MMAWEDESLVLVHALPKRGQHILLLDIKMVFGHVFHFGLILDSGGLTTVND